MPADEKTLGALELGKPLSRWMIEECVYPGVPRVYSAHLVGDEATKSLVTALPKEADFVDRIRHEASILRTLESECVPDLMDFGLNREQNVVWLAVEHYEGETLSDRLMRGALPWEEACSIFHQLACALRHVHEHSVIHGDVNPHKVLIRDDGRPLLIGFENSLDANQLQRSGSRRVIGALSYMAPESITKGVRPGPRADLYALGVVLHEALTGVPAFPAALMEDPEKAAEAMLQWKTRAEPLDPGDKLPDWLRNLVRKATHPHPRQRLPDLDAFVGWLEAAQGFWQPQPDASATPAVDVDGTQDTVTSIVPPAIVMAAPTLLAPSPEALSAAGWRPPEEVVRPLPSLPVVYLTAGVLGMVAGIACSVLVILFFELPNFT